MSQTNSAQLQIWNYRIQNSPDLLQQGMHAIHLTQLLLHAYNANLSKEGSFKA